MSASSEERWVVAWMVIGVGVLSVVSYLIGGWPGVGVLVSFVLPMLPVAGLLPWHFIAKHQGLMPRSASPGVVTVDDALLRVDRRHRPLRLELSAIARARIARNDNWTESKMLEDALTLFDTRGRELGRIPLSAKGFTDAERALVARRISIEERYVSAPAYLD